MRRTLATAAIFLSATAFAATAYAADADGTFDKSLSVSAGPAVTVSTGSGYIHINAGSDTQVHIIGHVHPNNGWLSGGSGDAESRVKQIVANPPISQSGNTVTIGTNHGDSDLFRNISIDYDVTMPRSSNVSAHSGSGGIQITGIQAPVNAGSGSGSLHLALAGSNNVQARTGSGSIQIEGINGGLNASTGSGSIEVNGNPATDWRLSTGSGSVRMHLADNAKFNLNASTGSGSVHIDQPITMQGSLDRHHVSGAVNGGGPTLHASTGSGSINISGNSTSAQVGRP